MFLSSTVGIYLTTVKNTVAWRFSMMLSLLTGPLFMLVKVMIWSSVYSFSGIATFGGLSFEEMVVYIVISGATGYLTWDGLDQDIEDAVTKGSLVSYLLKPVSYVWYQFVAKAGHRTLAFLIEFVPVMLIAGLFFGFDILVTEHLGWYAASVVLAFMVSFLLRVLVGMTAFWTVRCNGVKWLFRISSSILNGTLAPLSLFPEVVQKIFFVLPFQYVSFVPAQLFLGRYELAGVMFSQLEVVLYGCVQVLVLTGIVMVVWRMSIRRFCGAGT